MAFPSDPRDVELSILIDGQWVDAIDAGNGVRERQGITIAAGRADWASQVDAAELSATLDNRDGRWSKRNTSGAYAGNLRRNLPVRAGIHDGTTYLGRAGADVAATVASTPDAAALDITGDIDLRFEGQLDEDTVEVVTDGGRRFLMAAKGDGLTSGWAWDFFRNVDGLIDASFQWNDGAIRTYALSSSGVTLSELFQQVRLALRYTLDVSTGTGTWYVSSGLSGSWVQVGNPITGVGATSISTNSDPLVVGGQATMPSDTQVWPGRIYAFELRDGIDGTVVADPTFEGATAGASTVTDSSRTWTIGSGGRITNLRWRFHGELASLPTRWNVDGSDITAPIDAAGLLRRVRRRGEVRSVPRRHLERNTTQAIVQYWPCEETGSKALDRFGAAIGSNPIVVGGIGVPRPASNTDWLSSLPLPTLRQDSWSVTVDDYSSSFGWTVRWHLAVPDNWTGTDVTVIEAVTTTHRFLVQMSDTGSGVMRVVVQDSGGVALYTSGYAAYEQEGTVRRFHLSAYDAGAGALGVRLYATIEDTDVVGGVIHDATGITAAAGTVESININPNADAGDYSLGHLALYDIDLGISELALEASSFTGETAADRVRRLCLEEGVRSRIYGDPTRSQSMGPQFPGTISSLLQECATTDLGILHESAESLAIAYRVRDSMVAQGDTLADLTGLQFWGSTFDAYTTDQTFLPNRAADLVGSTVDGATLGSGSERPTITLATYNDYARIDADGTDDIIGIPYTPTTTPTAGALTIFFAGYWDSADTTADTARLISSESAGQNGILLHTSGVGQAEPKIRVGGATTVAQAAPATTQTLADGERFVCAAVFGPGTVAMYFRGAGLSATTSTTGVGTITHTELRAFARADTNSNNSAAGLLDIIVIERTLALAELDTIADQLYNRSQLSSLAFDASELSGPLEPDEDDADLVNDWLINNAQGGTARAVLEDGSALSVAEPEDGGAGRYAKSVTVSAPSDRLQTIADRLLAAGTVDEPRISRLPIGLHYPNISAGSKGVTLLEARLGDLVTVDGNLAAWGNRQIAQLIQGWTQHLTMHTDELDLFTSSAAPVRGRDLPAAPLTGGGGGPLGVAATPTSSFSTSGPVTVTNPDPLGSGTLVFISCVQGFGNAGTITWTNPDPAAVIQDTEATTSGDTAQGRWWTLTNNGAASYTFGGTSATDNRQTGVIIPLDGIAQTILKSSYNAQGGTSIVYQNLTGTLIGDLVFGVAMQQTTDELTVGPASYTEVFNDTDSTPNRIAVHSISETADGSEQPGNATWSGSAGGKTTYTMAFRGTGGSGGQGPTAARVANADLIIDVDPTDLSTWGKNRTEGQWKVGGDSFNPGANGSRHGLVWEADNATIESHAMRDGTVERLQQDTYNGRTVIHGAFQFIDDGSYTYQAGATNSAINVPPSDELDFDGNRISIDHQNNLISVGPNASPIIYAISFVVEPWMFANDYTSGPWALHDPTIYRSGPILHSFRNGRLFLSGKYSLDPIDPTSTANIATEWSASTSLALGSVGDIVTSVTEFVVDPGGAGYAQWWTLNNLTGEMVQVGTVGNDFGWIYDEDHVSYAGENDEFYPIMPNIYQFHQYSPPGVSNNWDLAGAGGVAGDQNSVFNVRRFRFFCGAVTQTKTAAEMVGHCKHFLGVS